MHRYEYIRPADQAAAIAAAAQATTAQQGANVRFLGGGTVGAGFEMIGQQAVILGKRGLDIANGSSIATLRG